MDRHPNPPRRRTVRRRASAFRAARRAAAVRRRAFRVIACVALAVSACSAFLAGALATGAGSVPGVDQLASRPLPSDTLVYDRTGQVLLADLHPPGYRHYERPLDAMGPYLPRATVAIEDANFWNEPGVSPLGTARAVWADLRARAVVEGGSTITQQLVKERLVGGDHSLARKLREAAGALQISKRFSKRQILGMYLNATFYGGTAYGAGAASRVYFHEDASQLDLAQAALLAGLPQGPTELDPLTHWDAAKRRQHQVLDAMVRAHDISPAEAERAFAEDLSPPDHLFGPTTTDLAPAFVDYVSAELADRFGRDAVQGGGLQVTTSLDWNVQQLAQRAVTDAVDANRWRQVTDGALVSIDPTTGQVVALVGSAGRDRPGGQYDLAVWPPRSPGSTFKIFTYATAISSRRYTMVAPVPDTPLTIRLPGQPAYSPENYGRRYVGVCQLQECLGNSLNVPAVQVELGTGVEAIVDQARRMGAPPYQQHGGTYTGGDPASSFGLSLTLGGYGETPLQMATGASALAAGGVLHQPQAILDVTSGTGQRVYRTDESGQRVLDPGAAYIVSQMLTDETNRRLVFGDTTPLRLSGHTAAAKTGTTDDFTDAWTVGYTPSLATAVWMGNADSSPMLSGSDGMVVAAPAWQRFMQDALDQMGKGDEWYVPPADVAMQWVNGRPAWFLPGTSPGTPPPALPDGVHLGDG
jgi:membrane peptidoglycan carboxypeptidase